MKARLVVLGVCAALLLPRPASAQVIPTPEEMGLNYTISAGAAIVNNSQNVRNPATVMLGVAYYDTAGDNFGQYSLFGISADWAPLQRNDGTTVQYVPVLFNYRQYAFISNYRVFVNLGVGVLALTDDVPEMQLESGANFGWEGGLGFDITNNLCFHARFIGGQHPGTDGVWSVQLGYRF